MTTSAERAKTVHDSAEKPFDPWEEYDLHRAATVSNHVPDAEGLLPASRRRQAEFPDYSHFHNPG